MFAKSDFSPSNLSLIQFLKESPSQLKNKKFSNSGRKTNPSKNNSNSPKTYHPLLSTMDLLSQQEPLITDISAQEPLKMWFADTQVKQVTLFLEGSAGIAMDYQSNTKSIKSWK